MKFSQALTKIQSQLKKEGIAGWLLYDFRRNNPLACRVLDIPSESLLTRRFFYWLPAEGAPVKIVSAIEPHVLAHLPGEQRLYRSWQDLQENLKGILPNSKKVAMEYSPRNAIPTISKVDAGTVEMLKNSCHIEVVTSANLLQALTSVWTEYQLNTHLAAADILNAIVERGWERVKQFLKKEKVLTEYDLQQFILEQIHESGCVMEGEPICAVNANTADPHYSPSKISSASIQEGDLLLIDLWAKQNVPEAVYADFTQMAMVGSSPTAKQKEVFQWVRLAQRQAIVFIEKNLREGKELQGWQVDRVCRDVIEKGGYGKFFIHRTGHNIDVQDHGAGANMDDFETHDDRFLLPGTCFSIEPGIYLPGEFGVRLEVNAYIHPSKILLITGKIQEEIQQI